MKNSLAFDPSAPISLGHTGLINIIFKDFNVIVSSSMIDELKEISKGKDKDTESAKKWLKSLKILKIRKTKTEKVGEEELFEICLNENRFLISDELRAIKRFKDKIKCYYSTDIIYILFKKGKISKERAIMSIEKMRTERSWKNIIIYVTSRTLFK